MIAPDDLAGSNKHENLPPESVRTNRHMPAIFSGRFAGDSGSSEAFDFYFLFLNFLGIWEKRYLGNDLKEKTGLVRVF